MEAAGERFERPSPEAIRERWPPLRFEAEIGLLVQEDGGVCMAERMVRAQARLAKEGGAEILERTSVAPIASESEGVEVSAGGATYRAPVGVVAAGAWAGTLLPGAGVGAPLVPTLEQITYFELDRPSALPAVIDWTVDRVRTPYLVPDPEHPGALKLGFHMSGSPVDPDAGRFAPVPEREAEAQAYVRAHVDDHHLTGATDRCLYTNTPTRISCSTVAARSSSHPRAADTASSSRRPSA